MLSKKHEIRKKPKIHKKRNYMNQNNIPQRLSYFACLKGHSLVRMRYQIRTKIGANGKNKPNPIPTMFYCPTCPAIYKAVLKKVTKLELDPKLMSQMKKDLPKTENQMRFFLCERGHTVRKIIFNYKKTKTTSTNKPIPKTYFCPTCPAIYKAIVTKIKT